MTGPANRTRSVGEMRPPRVSRFLRKGIAKWSIQGWPEPIDPFLSLSTDCSKEKIVKSLSEHVDSVHSILQIHRSVADCLCEIDVHKKDFFSKDFLPSRSLLKALRQCNKAGCRTTKGNWGVFPYPFLGENLSAQPS